MYIGAKQDGTLVYQTQIAKEFGIANSVVNYWVTRFKQEGLIYQHLKLTDKGLKKFKFLWENADKRKLRAHNIQIKFQVNKCPSGFPDCFSKSIYSPLTNGKYRGLKTILRGFTVMFYSPQKIICVLPDIHADNDEEISSAIQLVIPLLKSLLESEFQGIKIEEYELAKIQTMHIAVLNSLIAKKYLLKGFTKENKEYAIDNSHGVPEIELTNPSEALKEIMHLLNLEDVLKDRDIKTSYN